MIYLNAEFTIQMWIIMEYSACDKPVVILYRNYDNKVSS